MMMFEKVFFRDGRLRPFIRLLYSVVGILILVIIAGSAAAGMPVSLAWLPGGLVLLFWYRLLLLPGLLLLYALLSGLLEQRPLGSVGLAFHPRWMNELVIGLIAGAAMILAVAAAEGLLGFARFSPGRASPGGVVFAGAFLIVLLIVAAADEELIFRGYPFQRLVDSIGPAAAVVASSVMFGVAHFGNPFHTWVSTLNTALVGVLLAVCYLRTQALWLPLGVHFAWNFVQGYVLGLPVSGLALPAPILEAKISGPLWITGGAYGPEGSILTLGVIAAGTIYFFVSRRIFVTREMRELAIGPGDEKGTGNVLFSRDDLPAGKL